jgi:hypothetical protein
MTTVTVKREDQLPLGVDIQGVPPVSSDERMHELDRDCWCEPTVEVVAGRNRVRHAEESRP